ncbi:MAG: S41 family peptidase [Patescibacteria group bacterium]
MEKDFDSQLKTGNRWQFPWWLVAIFILVAFGFGFLSASDVFSPASQKVIKGISPEQASSTPGQLKNAEGNLPEYLTKDVDFKLFWEVWNLVKDKYYDKNIPETQMFYGALAGIVASLKDPYSVFMTAQDTDQFTEELKGNFEGIGIEIGVRNNLLTVMAPLPDTPASRAGLRAGDVILKIDKLDAASISLDKAVSLIRGKRGTEVALTITRHNFKEPKEIKIVREAITVKSIALEWKDDVAYIKVRQFNDDTIPLFDQAIVEIYKKKNVKGVILDLRNDPGGYLQSAIDMAGEWTNGEVVVLEKMRDGSEIKHRSSRQARLTKYQTVVLVNGGSASGSEIVAGALQDLKKATIVGEKSFGKGSVQDLTNLSDGSSIKLTIAKWFTPSGRSIEEAGIEPDIKIELSDEDYNNNRDPQLDKALEMLR